MNKETGVFKPPVRVEVIMAVFSRKMLTRSVLGQVRDAASKSSASLHVTLVDDGSSDGTAEMVRQQFSDIATVIESGGGLYWARGMSLAFQSISDTNFDYVLWLNDDVDLESDWLTRLLENRDRTDIVAGAMRDSSGRVTYSGLRRKGRRPGALSVVTPAAAPQRIDTFHGNLVLVNRAAAMALGGPDSVWTHGYGDIDYGYRAVRAGFTISLAPGYFGKCSRNSPEGTWQDMRLSRRVRVRNLIGRKGYPPRDQWVFVRRHGGVLAPAWFAISYLGKLRSILLRRQLKGF